MGKAIAAIFIITSFICGSVIGVQSATITPDLESVLQYADPGQDIPVIITLSDQADLSGFRKERKRTRRMKMVRALKDRAGLSQRPLLNLLNKEKARKISSLWLINAIAVTAKPRVILRLAENPNVASVKLDYLISPPEPAAASAEGEWNIGAIGAEELWALGYRGQGIVIASMDTGVDWNHPDLAGRWRGGGNSWYDPSGEHLTPYDRNGHGTQTMGIMVGGDAGGSSIGVAPDAKWIAVKIFNDANQAPLSAIHLGFQWLLDPDDNPATDDSPDVVNNSWGFNENVNECIEEFNPDIQALRAAGIAVVFPAGNEGPMPNSSSSPANSPGSLAVGFVDASSILAYTSSRGPSACDLEIYPELVSPGVNIRTSDLTFGGIFPDSYATVTGSSFAAPHVSGAIALLLSAFPNLAISEVENALKDSAVDLGLLGPDNQYGHGLIDATGAYHLLSDDQPTTTSLEVRVAATSDDAEEISRTSITLTSRDLQLTLYNSRYQTVGMRFKGIAIPQGAKIVSASIQFKADKRTYGSTALTIRGQAANNAPTFSTSRGNVSSRARTLASVKWNPAPWTSVGATGPGQQTPDLSSVIQEIVNRSGWVSGNSLAIIITGTGNRVAESYDGDKVGAPLLRVEYVSP